MAPTPVPEPQPVTVVREFYAKDSIRAYEFYSARLKDLFVKDDEAAGGDLGNLTFAFHVNGQDVEDGWEKTLRFDLVESDGAHAVVRVTFRNRRTSGTRSYGKGAAGSSTT